MAYHLLTGATGLLGGYLLRDLLRSGHRLAVLVRPNRHESARQRVERLLSHWESQTGEILPRPVVLSGDLTEPDLSLSTEDFRWIERHCRGIIHNAASLTFHSTGRENEPWRSNVGGTRNVLELCAQTGMREFHHVSTAYVCGLRDGRVLESELNVGQAWGNDYERSKVESETMVRQADFLDPPTIYRPSIILGDSRTGYTSTFHGFYSMVRLAHTLVSRMVLGSTDARMVIRALNLQGHERKNFVPVDWVSSVLAHLITRPEHYGKTYHLTAQNATPIHEWAKVIQEAVERYSPLADPSDPTACDTSWFEEMFRSQSDIYRTYWRDDPVFDCTNTVAAAPHLPCPAMDREMLMRMARYAINSNFGKNERRSGRLPWEAYGYLRGLMKSNGTRDHEEPNMACLGLQVNGPGGGQWKLLVRDGRLLAAEDGITSQCSAVFQLSSGTFQQLATRQLSMTQAMLQGQVSIAGDGMKLSALEAVLQAAVAEQVA